MAQRQPTAKERLDNHESRITANEESIKNITTEVAEVRKAVQDLTDNTGRMVELAEKFLPWLKNILYFLALVGANALLGGDTGALEKLVNIAVKFGLGG